MQIILYFVFENKYYNYNYIILENEVPGDTCVSN